MATTVESGFAELLNRLLLTQRQIEAATDKTNSVTSFFAANLTMAEPVISVGSYRRNTIIRSQRDVDLLAVLSYPAYKDYYDHSSRDFLYMVRNALNDHYGSTEVSSKRLAVKVDFSDIVVDVVPCFRREGGGYLMPNGNNGWLATNPPYHTQLVDQANTNKAGRLRPLVRLMKEWNIRNGNHLSSFHVELMVERMWRTASIGSSYSAALASTITTMQSWLRDPFDDPWTDGGAAVDSYLSTSARQQALRFLNEDAQNSAKAEAHRTNGSTEAAFECWGRVFRNGFPAFG